MKNIMKYKKCPMCLSTNISKSKEWFKCKDCGFIESDLIGEKNE